jgi:hypothetical protein
MNNPPNGPIPPAGGNDVEAHRTGRQQLRASVVSALLLLLVLAPVARNWQRKPKDDFPLSHYPMFSKDRQGKASVTYLLGIDRAGNRHFISYHLAGTGGFNQVRKQIGKRSRREPQALCRQVAAAVARRRRGPESMLDTVKVVEGHFAFDRFFAGDEMPQREQALCACPVERPLPTRPVALSKPLAP